MIVYVFFIWNNCIFWNKILLHKQTNALIQGIKKLTTLVVSLFPRRREDIFLATTNYDDSFHHEFGLLFRNLHFPGLHQVTPAVCRWCNP